MSAHNTPGLFARLGDNLAKTRQSLGQGLGDLLLGRRELDDELIEEIETVLLVADAGMAATTALIETLKARLRKHRNESPYEALRHCATELLEPVSEPLVFPVHDGTFVILAVGVNGVGKTTSCAKLAAQLRDSGHSVMLAAADTFRAAAVEQLQNWGARLDIPVIAQDTGADAAAVAHDAMAAARARNIDVLIIDTAGRQHTHTGLMDELVKIRRVIAKADATAPHEVLLVVDGGTGQNALNQLKHFDEAVGVTGMVLTKLDGTAKGGIVFAIAHAGRPPIRFIGVGEAVSDLRDFNVAEFVDALFPDHA